MSEYPNEDHIVDLVEDSPPKKRQKSGRQSSDVWKEILPVNPNFMSGTPMLEKKLTAFSLTVTQKRYSCLPWSQKWGYKNNCMVGRSKRFPEIT